jgi:hypothetical protein
MYTGQAILLFSGHWPRYATWCIVQNSIRLPTNFQLFLGIKDDNFPERPWAKLISQQVCGKFPLREELNFYASFRPPSPFEWLIGRSHLSSRSQSVDLRYLWMLMTEINILTLRVIGATEYSCWLHIHDFRIRSEAYIAGCLSVCHVYGMLAYMLASN